MNYEPDAKLLPQLTMIFKLLQLGGQIAAPQRFGGGNSVGMAVGSNIPNNPMAAGPTGGNTIFTMNNIYLLNLLCVIVKRLVKIAVDN